jgi:hypothetical protein
MASKTIHLLAISVAVFCLLITLPALAEGGTTYYQVISAGY